MVGDIYLQMSPTGDQARTMLDADRRFESCFRENYAAVLAFAIHRLPDRATAEDATSETFAVAWRRRELIPQEPLAWLYGIALRVVANQRRSGRRRRRLDDRLETEVAARTATPEPVDTLHRRDAFSRAFKRLSEDEREVLRLVAWDGLDTGAAVPNSPPRRSGWRRPTPACSSPCQAGRSSEPTNSNLTAAN
jgi:RNA polymerase sigma factor (sigma-70 family)